MGPTPAPSVAIVGRDRELQAIESFLGEVANGPRALLFEGEPGIGKTTLWSRAVSGGRAREYLVLVTRASQEEMPIAGVGLIDLFGADDLARGDASPERSLVQGRSLLDRLRSLAEDVPVLLAIDDVQWIDALSGRALRYALRRLETERVGLVATARSGSVRDEVEPTLAAFVPGVLRTIDLAPLDLDSLRLVLDGVVSSISRPMLRRIHELSGGNPMYAIELARALPEGDQGVASLPASLQEAIAGRLDRAPTELRSLLEVVAAHGRTSTGELETMLPDADVDRLLVAGVEHGLLVIHGGTDVRFAHPLLSSAVYEGMPPLARKSLHHRLAEIATDPDASARHLARSTGEPDEGVARRLEEAAERAQARGAHSLAAEFAGHSVRLTPSGGAEAAGRRTRLQIEALAAGGEVRDALALVDRTIEAMEPGPARAELLALRWHIESDDIETATSLLLQALDEAGEETHLRCRLLAMLGNERQIAGDLPGGIEAMREASALAERLGDEVLAARVDATLWHFELLAGTPRRVPSGEVLWLSESEVTTSAIGWDARIWIVRQRAWAGDLSGAIQMLEAVRDASSSADLVHPLVQAFYDLAILRCWAGDLASAKLLAEEGVRWARDSDDPWAESIFSFPVALRAVWAEPVPVARPAVQSLWERARAYGMRPDIIRARWLDGLLALRSTELAEAANDLAEAVDVLEQTGVEHPAPYPVLPDAVEALARAGDLDGARGLLERLERQAAAVSSRWGEAVARRAHGALLLAAGDAEDSLEPLGEAAGTLERLGFHLDAARAVHTRGSALVRLGQRTAAADAFADARARFGALGAGPWATRASEELERVAPGRSAGALTATEAQVAALVADGRKNREISAALFVSVATVEAHLTRIYRKLGISSRSDLTRLVAGGELLPPSASPEGEGAAGDLGETPSRRPRRPA